MVTCTPYHSFQEFYFFLFKVQLLKEFYYREIRENVTSFNPSIVKNENKAKQNSYFHVKLERNLHSLKFSFVNLTIRQDKF